MAKVLRIGLTGGIGSGKSTVAALLVAQGAALIDTDAISRSLTAPGGAALPMLAQEFGPDIVDSSGALDRQRMRDTVFADAHAKLRLEHILHPLISDEARRQDEAATSHVRVFDVPLLGEHSTWRALCHRVLVVDCSEATQIDRVTRRSGWPAEQVRAVIAQQLGRARRRAMADAVIHNDGLAMADLSGQVQRLWKLWVTMH